MAFGNVAAGLWSGFNEGYEKLGKSIAEDIRANNIIREKQEKDRQRQMAEASGGLYNSDYKTPTATDATPAEPYSGSGTTTATPYTDKPEKTGAATPYRQPSGTTTAPMRAASPLNTGAAPVTPASTAAEAAKPPAASETPSSTTAPSTTNWWGSIFNWLNQGTASETGALPTGPKDQTAIAPEGPDPTNIKVAPTVVAPVPPRPSSPSITRPVSTAPGFLSRVGQAIGGALNGVSMPSSILPHTWAPAIYTEPSATAQIPVTAPIPPSPQQWMAGQPRYPTTTMPTNTMPENFPPPPIPPQVIQLPVQTPARANPAVPALPVTLY